MFSTHEYALYVYTVPINTAYKSAIQGCARTQKRPPQNPPKRRKARAFKGQHSERGARWVGT